MSVWYHVETVQMARSPISGQELSCRDKIVKVAFKNHDNCAFAGSPIDFVSAAGLVKVP